MAMMVQGSDEIAEAALPVNDLAAVMRLPDGFADVPGQMARLQSRLRTAIVTIERRTGKALLTRGFDLSGTAEGGRRVVVPLSPVGNVASATVQRGAETIAVDVEVVEQKPHRPEIVLTKPVPVASPLSLSLTAGYSAWDQVPAPLREAVLLLAQTLDTGDGDPTARVDTLIAPYRARRIGGRV